MVKKLSVALLGIAFVLAGCNTVAGVGKPETFTKRSRFKEIRT